MAGMISAPKGPRCLPDESVEKRSAPGPQAQEPRAPLRAEQAKTRSEGDF